MPAAGPPNRTTPPPERACGGDWPRRIGVNWKSAALILLLSACSARPVPAPPVPWDSEAGEIPARPGNPAASLPAAPDEILPERPVPADIPPDQFVSPYPPVPAALPPPRLLPVQEPPASAPNFSPGLPPGPVTNYGTGGLQALPGAAPNSPYPPGGLMH
jgi:hypothetical protein